MPNLALIPEKCLEIRQDLKWTLLPSLSVAPSCPSHHVLCVSPPARAGRWKKATVLISYFHPGIQKCYQKLTKKKVENKLCD